MNTKQRAYWMEDLVPTRLIVRYDGRTGEIFGLSLRVGFLTLITLGIYRFWATTRVRRWFWSRITVDDERLEYSGTGIELFVAFIKVALGLAALLIPLRLAVNLYGPSPMAAGIISFAQFPFFGSLYILAVYYARRYRLSRTQWHGIRANLVGSSLDYWKLNVGYLLLTAVTLGIAYPYYRIATRRYLLDHTWFGDQKFSCTARARSLMRRWLIYVALSCVALGFIGFQVWDLVLAQEGGASPASLGTAHAGLVGTCFLTALVFGFFFIAYRTAEFRVLVDGLTFQNVRVSSSLSATRMLLFALKMFGAALLWMPTLGVVVLILARLLGGSGIAGHLALVGFAFFLFLLAISVFVRAYYTNGLLRRATASLSFEGALDVSRIGQTTAPVPRWGEGMLEAFDFAG
jgi:uncharacterized membrane protein YjgN (DUF898 family)